MSIKEAKIKFIVDTAQELFFKRGIRDVTIRDIAQEVGVGEATMYRHFSKKQNIVLAVAMSVFSSVSQDYFHQSQYKTGYDKIEAFYRSFYDIFRAHKDYFNFLAEFDLYISEQTTDLGAYENAIRTFFDDYSYAYNLGLKDGSLKEIDSLEVFYLATTHSILELCKKLAADAKVLKQDGKYMEKEIEMLINIYLDSIKKN